MKYSKFTIKNFKWIQNTTIKLELDTPSNIFPMIWLNESWKTTILQAIEMLDSDFNEKKAFELRPSHWANRFSWEITIKWTLKFSDEDIKNLCNFLNTKTGKNFYIENNQNRAISKIIIFSNWNYMENKKEYSYPDIWYKKFNESWEEKDFTIENEDKKYVDMFIEDNKPKIIFYTNFSNEIPDKIYLKKDSPHKSEKNSLFREVLWDILNYYHEWDTIEKTILNVLEKENTEESQNDINTLISELESSLSQDIIAHRQVLLPWDSLRRRLKVSIEKGEDPYLSFNVIQWSDSYRISARSLWFRRFFSFILFTLFRKKRKWWGWKYLFLIDEPASNLHQTAQQKILKNLFENIADENTTIIYSTHSVNLINPKYILSTYIIINDAVNYLDNWEFSDITNINAYLYKTYVWMEWADPTHYQPLKDAIDYSPNFLDIEDNIIFLEWKSDYYAFEIFSKILWINNIKFYPWASVNKYDPILRREVAEWRKFLAIFDSDIDWKENQQKYIENIWIMLEKNVFTYLDINENWDNFEIESLFSNEDKIQLKSLAENDSSEKKQILLWLEIAFASNFEDIKFSQETIDNFSRIFSFIDEKFKLLE